MYVCISPAVDFDVILQLCFAYFETVSILHIQQYRVLIFPGAAGEVDHFLAPRKPEEKVSFTVNLLPNVGCASQGQKHFTFILSSLITLYNKCQAYDQSCMITQVLEGGGGGEEEGEGDSMLNIN